MKSLLIIFFGIGSLYAVESKLLLDVQKTWNGTKIQKTKLQKPKITVQRLTIKKGEKLPVHKHQNVNVAYILKGELTIYDTEKGKNRTFKKGESFAEVIHEWHYGENKGEEDVVLLVVTVGNKNDKTIMKK